MITLTRLKIHWFYFKRGIKNLIHYFKVVWRNCDWDWEFMIELQKRKLDSMIEYYSNHKSFVGQEIELRYMKIARYCIRYLSETCIDLKNSDGTLKYVNDKNFKRIREANGHKPVTKEFWEKFKSRNQEYYLEDVYEEKLWYIYNKIIQTRSRWWN